MEQQIVRYRTPTRILHWVHAASFLVLFITGLIIFIPGLAQALTYDSWTRIIHRAAAVLFIVAPLVYIPLNPKSSLKGIKEAFTWGQEDMEWLRAAPRYYFLADEKAMPPQGHMNTGQKMWWFMVIFFSIIFVITGFIMWVFKESAPYAALQWAVFAHDVSFIATGTMFFLHIYLGVVHPLMRGSWASMARGKVNAEYARSHYRKWYDEVAGAEKEAKKS